MKTNRLDTKALERIENRLATLAKKAYGLADELSTAIYRTVQHHKHIVAAHKAHHTMKKRKLQITPEKKAREIALAYGKAIVSRQWISKPKGAK
jgi:hypothetical protein